jgi:hypothetical protein
LLIPDASIDGRDAATRQASKALQNSGNETNRQVGSYAGKKKKEKRKKKKEKRKKKKSHCLSSGTAALT